MKKSITLCFLALLCSSTLFATIRRVGFTDNLQPISGVDYVSFYLAHEDAVDGDTIYVYPGKSISQNGWPTAWGRAEITKRLVIVGKGSWLDITKRGNADYQATKGIATFGNSRGDVAGAVFFTANSAGSTIMGFDGQGQTIAVQCNNLTIKSNYNFVVYLTSDYPNTSNLRVEKNYRLVFDGDNNQSIRYTDLTIKNNFIYRFNLPDKSFTGTIANNTFAHDYYGTGNGGDSSMSYVNGDSRFLHESHINLHDGSWIFSNNLIIFNQADSPFETPFVINGGNLTFFNYNVAIQSTNFTSWPGTATGNVFLTTDQVDDIFEGFPQIGTRSADNRYMLKADSPAKAGSTSRPGSTVDAGMFGGTTPYKISTIPSIPTIYKISSGDGNEPKGNTITINVSTRSNN